MVKQSLSSVSDLKPGQQARLFPSLGYYDQRTGSCRALIHGRVFKDGRVPFGTRILLRGLKRAMNATPEQIQSETFQRRIDGFLMAPGRRRRIVLRIGNHQFRLQRRTRRNGAFFGTLTLPADAVPDAPQDGQTIEMHLLRTVDDAGMIGPSDGTIHFVPPKGVSVISDIDDTIKMTGATSRQEMLENTFLRPFEVVEGMAELYQHWHQQGCQFHYVSSSPWELYEPLAELCADSNFPQGSMHLRYFRVRNEMFKRLRPIRRNSKVGIIADIFKRLPQRRFILVGDSGEKDPEVYRFLARRFPRQVSAILIRNLPERPIDSKRMLKLNSVPATTQVTLFETTAEIKESVLKCQSAA